MQQHAIAPGPHEKRDSRFSWAPAHQHETLDELLYRIRGDTSEIAQVMDMNPHALQSPRLPEGLPIRLPSVTSAPSVPATLKLWD